MMPLPPTRFSTTNCTPNASLKREQARRPMTPKLPPAANGTSTLTGRCGQACACAELAKAKTSQARRMPHARRNMRRKARTQTFKFSLVPIDALAALVTLLRLDRERGNRPRFEPLERDRLAGLLTIAVSAILQSRER